ncbi:MAG: chromosomal replication initiator protein DnaA [Firmicutes bacterium]|nr:chromosomal replication initiator protein DnaA [Bacillota bacterium]
MDKTELWGLVLENMAEKVTSTTMKSFIKPASIREINDNPPIVYIETPKEMITNVIKRRYIDLLSESFESVTGQKYKIIVKNASEYREKPKIIEDNPDFVPPLVIPNFIKERIFDPALTFDNFVVGSCNEYAEAVCRAISEQPFNLYNPLFIYGGSGLGKTHLLNAVGIHLLENNDDIRILYVTAETFTNDFMKAISNKNTDEFKQKYRGTDVLLVDDIQFLEEKDKTQEEFFHTFNALLNNNKQIIVAGDRPPSNLTTLDKRLQSRFLMKTTAGLTFPDYETRVAILQKEAERLNISLNKDTTEVINYIAERITDNIRLLKGAFETVVSASILLRKDLNLSLVKSHLNDIIIGGGNITPQKIKNVVCEYYNISLDELDSETRKSNIAFPRQVAMYLCRTMTNYSLPRIGGIFGNKHYSTVKHACDKIDSEIMSDSSLNEEVKELINRINNY